MDALRPGDPPPLVYKVSGAGNDFLALVEPPADPSPETIVAWCRRGLSLGADGVLVLRRTGGGVTVRHWNSDGGRDELCLNGSRCAVELAAELGWADGRLDLATDAGTLAARRLAPGRVELGLPDLVSAPAPVDLDVDGERFAGWTLAVGVPHLVVPWAGSLARVPIATLGARLRAHPALGPAGANVDFFRATGSDRLEVRTFERGVEGETLACGTGVVATVAALAVAGRLRPPVAVLTAGGFVLRVGGRVADGRLRGATLEGDARVVARYHPAAGASELPPAPAWS